MKIAIEKGQEIDTDHLSQPALREIYETICNRADGVAFKIAEAKANSVKGIYADALWWRRITLLKRKLARASEALKTEIADRKRAERIAENAQWQMPKLFTIVAREMLPRDQYDEIMAEAKRRYVRSQSGHEEFANYVFEVGE